MTHLPFVGGGSWDPREGGEGEALLLVEGEGEEEEGGGGALNAFPPPPPPPVVFLILPAPPSAPYHHSKNLKKKIEVGSANLSPSKINWGTRERVRRMMVVVEGR